MEYSFYELKHLIWTFNISFTIGNDVCRNKKNQYLNVFIYLCYYFSQISNYFFNVIHL